MKKIILSTVMVILWIVGAFTAYADFENPAIVDHAELLTQEQFSDLSDRLNRIRSAYHFDVAVYIEETMSGDDAQSTADDIFDYNGYGCGETKDGMILYLSCNPRVYHFSTHGSGEVSFNTNGLAYLEKQILPSLQEDDYNTAILQYAKYSEELLEMAKQGKPFHKKQYSTAYLLGVIGCALLLPLAIAYLWIKTKLAKMKTAVKQDYAANYVKPGSLHMQLSRDLFLYSTVNKTAKQKSDSGSHTSSSGESHGGRGGSY